MASNRFIHKRTHARYSSEKSAQMNKARWDAVGSDLELHDFHENKRNKQNESNTYTIQNKDQSNRKRFRIDNRPNRRIKKPV